jgi:hypothetical protein
MRRAVHFAVLALLLLFMQHRAYVHPIEHFAGRAAQPQETVVSSPQADVACLECALLASGADTVVSTVHALASALPPDDPRRHRNVRWAAPAGAWFDSRAPPVFL